MAPVLGPDEPVRGGACMLRTQAICLAWAFYQYRLGALKLAHTEEGVDAASRGTLVHDALELFWNKTKTAEALASLACDGARLEDCIAAAAEESLAKLEASTSRLAPAFPKLEADRLRMVLREWLMLEARERTSAFEVIGCEQAMAGTVGGVPVRLRVDASIGRNMG